MIARIASAFAAAAQLGGTAPGGWQDRPHGPVYATNVAPMDHTVSTRMMPQVEALVARLLREKREMKLSGVKVFESGDRFLPG